MTPYLEARSGRTNWVWADYIAEGYRVFDREYPEPRHQYGRAHYAMCWAEVNCPHRKRNPAAVDASSHQEKDLAA